MTVPCRRIVQIAAVLSVLGTMPASAEAPVELRVTTPYVFEGADVFVTVRIASNDDNRMLTVQADSPDYYRSSAIQLSGSAAPRVHTLRFRSLPSGEYEVRAILTRADDVAESASRPLQVIAAH